MNIVTKGTHIEITDAIGDYLDKRLQSLGKFLDPNAIIKVELAKTSNHHRNGDIFRAELHITSEGKTTYMATEQADLYAAIDIVKDEAVDALSSKKDKRLSLMKRTAQRMKKLFRK